MVPSISGKLSVKDFADHIGASRFTIYRMIKLGKIPAYALGRKVILDLEEALASMRTTNK